MFWFVMLLIMLGTIGGSVLIGMALNRRGGRRGTSGRSREEIAALKSSGALPGRKIR